MFDSLDALCARIRTIVWLADGLPIPRDADAEQVFAQIGELGALTVRSLNILAGIDRHPELGDGLFGASSLDDTAFMARMELRHFGAWVFSQRGPVDAETARVDYERLRQHLIESLVEVEIELSAQLCQCSELRGLTADKLERSRAVRRAYYRFITRLGELVEHLETGRSSQRDAAQAATEALELLLEDPVASHVRPRDLSHLESLCVRARAWRERGTHDELETRRLWLELRDTCVMLARIQGRRELLVHDCEFAAKLLWTAQLRRCSARKDLRLQELATRDPRLARALEQDSDAELGRALEQLHDELAYILARPTLAARRAALDVTSI